MLQNSFTIKVEVHPLRHVVKHTLRTPWRAPRGIRPGHSKTKCIMYPHYSACLYNTLQDHQRQPRFQSKTMPTIVTPPSPSTSTFLHSIDTNGPDNIVVVTSKGVHSRQHQEEDRRKRTVSSLSVNLQMYKWKIRSQLELFWGFFSYTCCASPFVLRVYLHTPRAYCS